MPPPPAPLGFGPPRPTVRAIARRGATVLTAVVALGAVVACQPVGQAPIPGSSGVPGSPSTRPSGDPSTTPSAPADAPVSGSPAPSASSAVPAPGPSSAAPQPPAPATSCDTVPMAPAGDASGPAPTLYGGTWTPAPVEGCTVTDAQGRVVTLTAVQNRMRYRVNELRRLQSEVDDVVRPALEPDFCLQELAQGYAATKPTAHNPLLTAKYPHSGDDWGTGNAWIAENLAAHAGHTSDQFGAVDRLVRNLTTSGTVLLGGYGTMLDATWHKVGFGITVEGDKTVAIQNFSVHPAMFTYPDGRSCSTPPDPLHGDSTVPPINGAAPPKAPKPPASSAPASSSPAS